MAPTMRLPAMLKSEPDAAEATPNGAAATTSDTASRTQGGQRGGGPEGGGGGRRARRARTAGCGASAGRWWSCQFAPENSLRRFTNQRAIALTTNVTMNRIRPVAMRTLMLVLYASAN